MKRTYEALYILKPTLIEEEVNGIVDLVAGIAEENGSTILTKGKWDKRRLAYEIKHYREGIYCLTYFESDSNVPALINRAFRINDDILRGMITVVDKRYVDVTKIDRPSVAVEEVRETIVPAPEPVIPTEEELAQVKEGNEEIAEVVVADEVVETDTVNTQSEESNI